LTPTSVKAIVAGYDVWREPEQVKRRVEYMSQRFSLYEDLSERENIRFFGGPYLSYSGCPLGGSIGLVTFECVLYMFVALSLGIFISTRAKES